MINLKKAFTLTELIVVVAIIWILMMGITVYIWGLWERAKIIEAQWCSTSIWWELNNYVFYALTSKNLKTGDNVISTDYYFVQLTGGTSTDLNNCTAENYTWDNPTFCDEIVVGYGLPQHINKFDSYTSKNTCKQDKVKLWFYRSGTEENISYIKMNRWFSPIEFNDDIFSLHWNNWSNDFKLLEGDIIIVLCSNENCYWWKEVARLNADARIQKITLQKCVFYKDDDIAKCDKREN